MAKEKVTITVDRAKLNEARAALGMSSASGAIDVALSELIGRNRVRGDVKAYMETPETEEEITLGSLHPDWRDLLDETDWEAEWPES